MMADLFSYRETYPESPGWKGKDTSRQAAADMKPRQGTIQAMVLDALAVRPMASFELARHTGVSYRSIQPRTSELSQPTDRRRALIQDSGRTAIDPETGKHVTIWRIIQGDTN